MIIQTEFAVVERPTILALSPHLDDAAFSIGGTLAALRRRGCRVIVATVFTASVARPTGFALACQLDKGLPPDVDYLSIRRDEDLAFGRTLGIEVEWLGLPEAPHRGYESAPALFQGIRQGDPIGQALGQAIDRLTTTHQHALIISPRAIGNHVDHLMLVQAMVDRPELRERTAWYRDLPYASRFPDATSSPLLPRDLIETPFELEPEDLQAKIDGSACYTTQVGFQFGGVEPMAKLLTDFAVAEGLNHGLNRPAEAFLVKIGSEIWAKIDR